MRPRSTSDLHPIVQQLILKSTRPATVHCAGRGPNRPGSRGKAKLHPALAGCPVGSIAQAADVSFKTALPRFAKSGRPTPGLGGGNGGGGGAIAAAKLRPSLHSARHAVLYTAAALSARQLSSHLCWAFCIDRLLPDAGVFGVFLTLALDASSVPVLENL